MDGNLVSAATLVGAVLEHQGYLVQMRFLNDFRDFFRDAGALVYLIGGVGAVFSFALMGSFRAARYLVISPALFWFLVGPTTNTQGVVWRLGGGTPHGQGRAMGEGEAVAFRDKLMQKLNATGEGFDGSIKVATGFWLFARPINEFVNEFVDVLLKDEDGADQMLLSKADGLEMIATYLPENTEAVQMLEQGLYANCSGMMNAAHAAAWTYIKEKVNRATGTNGDLETIRKTQIQRLYEQSQLSFNTVGVFRQFIDAQIAQNGPSYQNGVVKQLTEKYDSLGIEYITCEDAWKLVAEHVWFHAGRPIMKILNRALDMAPEEFADYACKELTRKAVDETQGDVCNLRPAIAVAILYRHLARIDTWGRALDRVMNDGTHKNPAKDMFLTSATPNEQWDAARVGAKIFGRETVDILGRSGFSVLAQWVQTAADGAQKIVSQWYPVANVSIPTSPYDAMLVSTRQHEIVQLRQTIFSYALNFPYYQGMLLYIIAAAYPFMALLVLLPGRAPHVLNVPLAWLWVKSWDIGFAIVIILDKIMYNLLPSRDLPKDLQTGPWLELEKLPKVLGEGYNFDPLGSLHAYYAVMAMALLSVPVLTGAMTIRAKKAILGEFTQGLQDNAKDSGSRATNAWSQQAAAQRMAMWAEVQGMAKKMPTLGEGIESGLKQKDAMLMARAAAMMKGVKDTKAAQALAGGKVSEIAGLPAKLADTYLDTYARALEQGTKLESAVTESFDPNIGRWSNFGMRFFAYTSAMDATGGFEMSDVASNATGALIDSYQMKLGFMMDALGDADAAILTRLGAAAGGGGRIDLATLISAPLVGEAVEGVIGSDGWRKATLDHLYRTEAEGNGYSRDEFLARTLHTHRSVFFDRETGAKKQYTLDDMRETGPGNEDEQALERRRKNTQERFDRFYGVINGDFAPGGADSLLDALRTGSGGTRFVEERPADALPHTEDPNSGWRGWLHDASRNTDNPFFNMVTLFDQNSWLAPANDKELRLQADSALQYEQPRTYGDLRDERLRYLIQRYGEDKVDRALERHAGGAISVEELAAYIEKLDREERSSGAQPSYMRLDSDIKELARTNPLYALERMEDWTARQGGQSPGKITTIPADSNIILHPFDFLDKRQK